MTVTFTQEDFDIQTHMLNFAGIKLFATEGKAILTAFAGLIISFIMIWGLNKLFMKDKNFLPTIHRLEDVNMDCKVGLYQQNDSIENYS